MNFPSTRHTRRPLVLAVALALGIGSAQAATITVNTGGDAGTSTTCTLRQALVAANTDSSVGSGCMAGSGIDTIQFDAALASAVITLTGGELGVSQSLIINGSDQTIDAGGLSRVLSMNSISLTASSLTLTGGSATGDNGGGIFVNFAGVLDLADVTITGNSADGRGGGIFLRPDATLAVTNCTISGNSANYHGGGIYLGEGATLTATDSTVSGNSAGGAGGGVNGLTDNTISVVGSTISGNTAVYSGGGLYALHSSVAVTDSTISGNTADTGGGICAQYQNSFTIANSTISDNVALLHGGGISMRYGGALAVTNSTISGNAALLYGGGIYADSDVGAKADFPVSVTLQNSILSANTAPIGPDLTSAGPVPNPITAASSLLGSALSGSYGGNGNVYGDAPGLGALGANGGLTLTMLPLAGSPAIDAGDNSLIPTGITTDQRGAGHARIVNTTVDIGAVEVQAVAPPVANVSVPASAPWALGLLGLLLGFFGLRVHREGSAGARPARPRPRSLR